MAPGPSLLQSIRSAPKKLKRDDLPVKPPELTANNDATIPGHAPGSIPSASAEQLPAPDDNNTTKATAAPTVAPAATGPAAPLHPAKKLKSMASKSFYKTNTLRLEHVEERVLRFLAQIRDRAVAGGAVGQIWRQFPTQQAAFDFADQEDPTGERLRIFSVELASTGTRRFLVTSYTEFWKRYSVMLPHHRHYYEIIRQGWPCHLYLDLEFNVEDNPERDGQAAVDAVLSMLRQVLQQRLGVQLNDQGVLELDSSTVTKFSRHLIVRLPGAAFANNLHAGVLIHDICKLVTEKRDSDPLCAQLFVKKGADGSAFFIDTGVYTRNRAFRLHLSSKAGKTATLLPTGRYGTATLRSEKLFFDSLVCNVAPETRLLRCFDENNAPVSAAAARAAARKLFGNAHNTTTGATGANNHQNTTSYSLDMTSFTITPLVPHTGPSPFPDIDSFIEYVSSSADPSGPRGSIRSWVALDNECGIMLYNVKGSRYCGNVARHHKSNGVFFIVDLQQGVWYQKCYDPECRMYRSPVTALPEELMKVQQEVIDEDDEEEEEDEGDKKEEVKEGQQAEANNVAVNTNEDVVWGDAEDNEWDEAALAAVEKAECALAFL
jgi:hypothetical protein